VAKAQRTRDLFCVPSPRSLRSLSALVPPSCNDGGPGVVLPVSSPPPTLFHVLPCTALLLPSQPPSARPSLSVSHAQRGSLPCLLPRCPSISILSLHPAPSLSHAPSPAPVALQSRRVASRDSHPARLEPAPLHPAYPLPTCTDRPRRTPACRLRTCPRPRGPSPARAGTLGPRRPR